MGSGYILSISSNPRAGAVKSRVTRAGTPVSAVGRDWFNSNDMQDYNSTMGLVGRSWIDDRANSIALRKDIHGLFDTGSFVFVRKRGNWVAHCLRVTNEFGPMYHNRVVSIHEGVSPHFLLARFAWAIFRFATRMFGTNELRLIRLRVPDKEGERHDIERPGYSVMDSIEKEKGGRSKKRKTEGEEKTGGEKDSGVCSDDEATFVATETSESTILGSKFTPEYKRAKVPSLDLTPVNVITIPRRFSSFDRHIAEMKRRALLKQRPDKPELLCCDYEAADKAAELGLPSNLCDECLGWELPNTLGDSSVNCI